MNKPKHVVVVGCLVKNDGNEVLLIRHHKRGWEIPQGRVEEGENLLDAAHREVLEETGVEVDLGPLAAVWSKISSPPALIFNFLASYKSGIPTASDEAPELGWFSPVEALAMVVHPVNRDRLESLLTFSGNVIYRSYSANPYQVHVEANFGASPAAYIAAS